MNPPKLNRFATTPEARTRRDPATSIEPMLTRGDLPILLSCGMRTIERLKSAGRLPKPDLLIGTGSRKSPRWKPETIRRWIEDGGAK